MSESATIEVLSAGLLTTVQDRGRSGFRHLGVGRAGALDAHSAQIANRLVGNDADAALIEMTLSGATLRFHAATRIAIAGADIDARVGALALPGWRPVDLPRGADVAFGVCRRGARAYVAVAGGIDVPRVLGSRSTDLRGGFGGVLGRALRAGDRLPLSSARAIGNLDAPRIASWWVDATPEVDLHRAAVARVLDGAASLASASRSALLSSVWQVAAASDRIGLRLQGEPLQLAAPPPHVSEPVCPGTVQLPPDGRPIVLLGDCGTVGGYPRIAQVIDFDLPRLAQLRPGETLHFASVDLATADRLSCERAARLSRMQLAIERRLAAG